jgi:GT2 family glycosyltransferase
MNTAIMKGRAPYQAWLNNDVLVGPEWLERLIAAVESDPAAGAAGPCTNDPDCGCGRGARYSPGPRELPGFAAAWAVRFDGQREEVPLLAGFCFLVKRDAVARVGLLDERFFWGEEDDDYSLRLRLAGYRLLLALDVFVSHRGHCTGEKRRSRQRLHDGENIRLLRRKWVQGLERIRPSPLKRHPRASGPSSRPGSRGSQGNIRAACPRAG